MSAIFQVSISGIFVAIAGYMFWAAYQVKYKNRADLVSFGRREMPGVLRLKNQFSALHFIGGLGVLGMAITLIALENSQPALWVMVGISGAVSVRREMLIRALEKYASTD